MSAGHLLRTLSIIVAFFIVLVPFSYAQQISDQATAQINESQSGNKEPETTKTEKVLGEAAILVSEDSDPRDVIMRDNNECSRAEALDLETLYRAYIDYSGDNDWYKWSLPSRGRFTLDLDVPPSKDYDLKVYRDCSTLACTSNRGTGSDEQCVVSDASSGWIYAWIYGYEGAFSSTEPYDFRGSFTATGPSYDLAPVGFLVTPSSPSDEDSISVVYEIKNNGPNDITSSFNFKLNIDGVHQQTCLAGSGLRAGWYAHCTKSDIRLSAGTHRMKIVADADNNIAETDEGNNVLEQDLPVRRAHNYDLSPGAFGITPSSPTERDTITIRYRAVNNGPDDITTAFEHRLYIDGTHYQTCVSSGGLRAGWEAYCDKTGITLTAGTHRLRNVVDATSTITETNEGNNVLEEDLLVSPRCPPDYPNECGDSCWSNCAGDGIFVCRTNGEGGCCPASHPYYCGRIDRCTQTAEQCNNANRCGSEDWTVCTDAQYPYWNCRSDGVSRCCPIGHPYLWNSDYLCHTTPESDRCPVPDGTTASCDCDTDEECRRADASRPYCGETYGVRTAFGYHACYSARPEYCGNGNCNAAAGEDFNNCPADCSLMAPMGTVNVAVTHSVTAQPISGAPIYLDGTLKGVTDGSGRKSFEARYGRHDFLLECPDRSTCSSRTLSVDGSEYLNAACDCLLRTAQLRIRARALNTEAEEGYPISNVYLFLDGEPEPVGQTDTFGNLYLSNVNIGPHRLGVLLKVADEEGQEPYEHRYSADITVTEEFEEWLLNFMHGPLTPAARSRLSQNVATFSVDETAYNSTYVPEVIPFVVIGAVVAVGFTTWAFVDYARCVEENDDWWGSTGELLWTGASCNLITLPLGSSIDKEHINNCGKKWRAIGKNTVEKCKLELATLATSFIPSTWFVRAAGRVIVVLKGTVHTIPYVEKFIGYSYRVVKESDTVIHLTDGITTFKYKLVEGAMKLYDNIVGVLVKIMDDAGVSARITSAVDDVLRNTHPSPEDFPGVNLRDFGNVKGALGEKVAREADTIAGQELVDQGATFFRYSGEVGDTVEESARFALKINEKKNVIIWDKLSNSKLGEVDDVYKVNAKPIVTEVKTKTAASFDQEIISGDFSPAKVIRNMDAIKEVTGEVPEFVIMLPKGEAALSAKLPSFLNAIRTAGYKAEAIELKATNSQFNAAANEITR